jgi:hypothetical protein
VKTEPKFLEAPFRISSPPNSSWTTDPKTVPRLGAQRSKLIEKLNQDLGENTWRFAWDLGNGEFGNFEQAISLYEESYFEHLKEAKCPKDNSKRKIDYLSEQASNVFDTTEKNENSGYNYYRQDTPAAHFQDIAIRRVMAKMGIEFQGNKPIRVRSRYNTDPVGISLSPKKVPFIKPEIVKMPLNKQNQIPSIEDFWQYNRVIQFCNALVQLQPEQRNNFIKEPRYPDPNKIE